MDFDEILFRFLSCRELEMGVHATRLGYRGAVLYRRRGFGKRGDTRLWLLADKNKLLSGLTDKPEPGSKAQLNLL